MFVDMNIPQKHYIEPDVLLVHKPIGISSFDVIRKLRVLLGVRKIGHAGTLDPLAHGIMIVGIGSGTKKLNHYLKLSKTYVAEILIGKSTTTGDLEGDIVEQKTVYNNDLRSSDLEGVIIAMKGKHILQAPLYSAIKVQGKALYQYARQGVEPPYIPEKEMEIQSIQFLDHYHADNHDVLKIRVQVSSGSYIRSLGEEFGRRIGYPATLKNLYRVSIDAYQDSAAYRFHTPSRNKRSIYDIIKSLFVFFAKK